MKYLYTLIGLALVSFWISCQNLDLNPLSTGSSENWYSTENEIEMSVKGLYRMPFWKVPNYDWADDYQYRNLLSPVAGGTMTSENATVKNIWDNMYKAIARANIVLSKIDHAIESGITSKQKGELFRAEAYFIRAQMYATLVVYFGDVVYTTKTLTLEEAFTVSRTPKSEIIPKIYEDFDQAVANLPEKYASNESKRATKGAAYALKARFALFNKDWDIAADAAKQCIDMGIYELHPSFSELFLSRTRNAKESIFFIPRSLELGSSTDEQQLAGDYVRNRLPRNCTGWGAVYPTWDLFLAFLCTDGKPVYESPLFDPHNPFENRDPRCTASIVEFGVPHMGYLYDPNPKAKQVLKISTGKMVTNQDNRVNAPFASYNGLLQKKGVDDTWLADGTYKVDPDLVIIRLADVYLIYAEAKMESNKIDKSTLDAINIVRARAYGVDMANTSAYPAVTTSNQAELRKIVRSERRMELAFEGWRYYDIIRWGIAEKALNRPDYGMLEPKELIEKIVDKGLWFFPEMPSFDEDGIPDYTSMYEKGLIKIITNRKFDASKQYLFPIPSKELVINKNITQNPNY